jgi:hypothetical protein
MTHYSLNSTPIRQNVVKPAMKANLQNLDADLSRIFGYLFSNRPFMPRPGQKDRICAFIAMSWYFMLFCQQQNTTL